MKNDDLSNVPSSHHLKQAQGGTHEPNHERSDLNVKGIYLAGVSFVVFMAVILGLIGWIYHVPVQIFPRNAAGGMPQPNLMTETAPGQTLRILRAKERVLLETYAWTDETHRTARVPIERALELISEKKLVHAVSRAPVAIPPDPATRTIDPVLDPKPAGTETRTQEADHAP